MNHRNQHSVRSASRSLKASVAACVLLSAIAIAQTSENDSDPETRQLQVEDEIIVTGSRISRSGFETPAPVTIVE